MVNKRGAELSTNTIILIILGLIVLVVLVLGFTIGWGTILPWLSSNNVNTISNQCQAACTTSDTYGFCAQERTLKAPDLPDGKKEALVTCDILSKDSNALIYGKYNIAKCSVFECPAGPEEGAETP